jgi:predicted AAA+ superfamily ATPase
VALAPGCDEHALREAIPRAVVTLHRLLGARPDTRRMAHDARHPLPLDLLVGVDRQKARFVENLSRFARGLPANHALLWGVRGTGKSSLAKAAFMAAVESYPALKLVEVDRDEVTALPALFDVLRDRSERFVVLCDDLSFEDGAAAAKALKARGATSVAAYCTHAVLSGKALHNINNSELDELVVTDTIPLTEAAMASGRIRQLSVAGLIGESINRMSLGQSLSSMFID